MCPIDTLTMSASVISLSGQTVAKNITLEWVVFIVIAFIGNGVLNYLSLIMALTIPAAIMFPVRSAAGVILNTLILVFCFKEKLSVCQLIGIAVGTASIVILNM